MLFRLKLVPLADNVVEMLKDDPAGCTPVRWAHVVSVRLDCLKRKAVPAGSNERSEVATGSGRQLYPREGSGKRSAQRNRTVL